MKKRTIVIALSMATLLTGCGSSDNKDSSPIPVPPVASAIDAKYQGNWIAPGYGLSLKIEDDALALYRFSSGYCYYEASYDDIDTDDVEQFLREADNAQLEWFSGSGTSLVSTPGTFFEKAADLPASCQSGVFEIGDAYTFDAPELWQFYTQIFDEYYVDFAFKNVDWAQVVYDAGININNGSNEQDLFIAMATTLEALADTHNFVRSDFALANPKTKPQLIERLVEEFANDNNLPFPIPQEVLTQQLVNEANSYIEQNLEYQWELVTGYAAQESDIKSAAGGLIRWFENDGLGYLYIGGMAGYSESQDELEYISQTVTRVNAAIDQALNDMANVDGMIVDVRVNNGGHDYVSLTIANHFTDVTVPAYSKQARDGNSRTALLDVEMTPYNGVRYTGPVALLTSTNTVSAAEVFTLSMRELPNVTIIGDATQGVFSDVMTWQLPNGFEIGLSNEFYLSTDGDWFEGQGVPVDIEVPFFTRENREQEVDAGIEAAVAHLSQ